jgi:DNA-binding HxlR family transcriptional regulator
VIPSSSEPPCPVSATAELVGGKWTLLVIRDLAAAPCRFCELERSLAGISPRTLSLRLRGLEDEGILVRRTCTDAPPRVEYALTEKGRALLPLIEDMRRYGQQWLCDDAAVAGEDAREQTAAPVPP